MVFAFKADKDREHCMEQIDKLRVQSLYHHECNKQNGVSCLQAIGSNIMHMCVELLPCLLGCGQLFVTDGLWKLDYPVCIYKVPVEVKGMNVRRYKTMCLLIQHPLLTILFCTGSTS